MERRAKLNHPEEHAPRVSIVSLDDRQFAHSVFKTIGQSSDAGQDLRRTIFQEMGIPLTQVAPTGCGLPLVFPEVG